MVDIGYLFSLAFSGSDVTRAIWLMAIGALIASRHLPPSRTTLLMLIIDRLWPFVAMASAGHDVSSVSAALGHAITSIPADASMLLVRGIVFYAVISLGYQLRLRVHGRRATLATGKRA